MGKIKMPMGIMNFNVKAIEICGNTLSITADLGSAPNYVGRVEIELLPRDFEKNFWKILIWVSRRVLPRVFISKIKDKEDVI